jgi:hypothetical protein
VCGFQRGKRHEVGPTPTRSTGNPGDQRSLNDRDRIDELQINQQVQTVVDLDEFGLLGADRRLELRIVLSSKVGSSLVVSVTVSFYRADVWALIGSLHSQIWFHVMKLASLAF